MRAPTRQWLVLMGPHRFVIPADDQEHASKILDQRLAALGLERGLTCEFVEQHPEERAA